MSIFYHSGPAFQGNLAFLCATFPDFYVSNKKEIFIRRFFVSLQKGLPFPPHTQTFPRRRDRFAIDGQLSGYGKKRKSFFPRRLRPPTTGTGSHDGRPQFRAGAWGAAMDIPVSRPQQGLLCLPPDPFPAFTRANAAGLGACRNVCAAPVPCAGRAFGAIRDAHPSALPAHRFVRNDGISPPSLGTFHTRVQVLGTFCESLDFPFRWDYHLLAAGGNRLPSAENPKRQRGNAPWKLL